MRTTLLCGAVLLSVAATGCTVRTRPYAEPAPVYTEPAPVYTEPAPAYAPEPVVFHEPPPLVSIEPDVYVVHNYPVPVYYVDGFYWRFHAGIWYRAADYNAGWVTVNVGTVPRRIAYRDHRHYVRYSPPRAVIHRAPTRYHTTTPRYRQPARTYRSPVAPRAVPQPQRQVVRPGYVRERTVPQTVPQRRPAYNEPVQRQRVRGREAPPPRPRAQPPPRPKPPVKPRRDDRRRVPPNTGTDEHPHQHTPERPHHH